MNKIWFGKINRVIFFGGTSLMVKLIKECKEKFEIYVITSDRFTKEIVENKYTFLDFLQMNDIWYQIIKDIDTYNNIKNIIDTNTIGISISAPWIFKQKFINLFSNRFINIHRAPLPEARGCASISWALMQGKTKWGYTYHIMTKDIDGGHIILQEHFSFPLNFQHLEEYNSFLEKRILNKFKFFIKKLCKIKPFSCLIQNEVLYTYWPRLNTDVHSYIDWNWNAINIANFILAFSKPFNGAKTFINGIKPIHIKKVIFDYTENSFHPYQSGLIYRKNKKGIYVAAQGSGLFITDIFCSKGNQIQPDSIKLGDRLYTPIEYLEKAKLTRIFYKPNGEIEKSFKDN